MTNQLPAPPVRHWRRTDVDSVAALANEWDIAKNLRDAFPHPYTRADAESWIAKATSGDVPQAFAIEVDGAAVGGIGFKMQTDIERCSAELGYWLGKPYWGRGLVTAAVRSMTKYAFEHLGLLRVYALPFTHNPASARVLEKAGFVKEGELRYAAIKAGQPVHMIMFAKTRDP